MSEERASKTAALTKVNGHVLSVARGRVAKDQQWAFFCECGRADCHEYVSLTLAAYNSIRDGGNAVVARGHWLSQGERARRLRAASEALVGDKFRGREQSVHSLLG